MSELQKADPRARRAALIVVAIGTLGGAGLILLFETYRTDVAAWIAADDRRIRLVIAALVLLTAGPALAMAAYLWRLGHRTIESDRYPPPGLRVVRDTRVVIGPAARRVGRVVQVAASVLAGGGVLLAVSLWRLLALFANGGGFRSVGAVALAVALSRAVPAGAQDRVSIPAPDGGAAAQASIDARPGEIDRIVLLAHMPVSAPEGMRGRKLFIVSRDDPGPGGTPRLVRIRDQYERASDPKELIVLDGSAHAQFIFDTAQGDRLMQEILRFLSAP
jgi:hypothetical protein